MQNRIEEIVIDSTILYLGHLKTYFKRHFGLNKNNNNNNVSLRIEWIKLVSCVKIEVNTVILRHARRAEIESHITK